MIAIIKTGGKQYLVKEGDTFKFEKLPGVAGDAVHFDHVLLVAAEDGSSFQVGQPTLEGMLVKGTIIKQARTRKIRVIKFKRKVRYSRRAGHRQEFTEVKIEKIG